MLKTNRVVILIVVVILGYLIWELLIPHRYESSFLSKEQAQRVSPIPLPDAATNVYVARYRHWQAYADYVRFEAPLSVCIAHAKALTGKQPIPISTAPLSPLWQSRWKTYGFEEGLPWFDAQDISSGLVVGGGPSIPECWIDETNSIFYYSKTD